MVKLFFGLLIFKNISSLTTTMSNIAVCKSYKTISPCWSLFFNMPFANCFVFCGNIILPAVWKTSRLHCCTWRWQDGVALRQWAWSRKTYCKLPPTAPPSNPAGENHTTNINFKQIYSVPTKINTHFHSEQNLPNYLVIVESVKITFSLAAQIRLSPECFIKQSLAKEEWYKENGYNCYFILTKVQKNTLLFNDQNIFINLINKCVL